jgi:hypothetical protein
MNADRKPSDFSTRAANGCMVAAALGVVVWIAGSDTNVAYVGLGLFLLALVGWLLFKVAGRKAHARP